MRLRLIGLASAVLLAGMVTAAQEEPAPPQTPPNAARGQGSGRGAGYGRGWGGSAFLNGRGIAGTVSEVAADHYAVKTAMGETYTFHYSPNTKILKQPAQRTSANAMRVPPQEIKSTDIRVGDVIMAMGEVDTATKAVGALSVVNVDPERAR